jgi:hypothetical protein
MSMNRVTSRSLDAFDLMIMSVWKPDSDLRSEAYNMNCYQELMSIRDDVIKYLEQQRKELQEDLL